MPLTNPLPQTKSAKQHAREIARNIVREPFEIGKTASAQITGLEYKKPDPALQNQETQNIDTNPIKDYQTKTQESDQLKSNELLKALENELKEITKKDLLTLLQQKISQGEEVYLDDYPNLSLEEKQVLKAQMQAVLVRQNQTQDAPLVEPNAKKSRNFIFGLGKKPQIKGPELTAERQKQRVERPMAPSG